MTDVHAPTVAKARIDTLLKSFLTADLRTVEKNLCARRISRGAAGALSRIEPAFFTPTPT
jgi:hypothetical protein